MRDQAHIEQPCIEGRRAIGTIGALAGIMSLAEPFWWAWSQMVDHNSSALNTEGEYVHYDRSRYSLHWSARNELVERMRGDWLLMLDTDVIFDPDVAARMVRTMEQNDLDVVAGIYPYKKNPSCPVLFLYNPETDRHDAIVDWDRSLELFEFSGGGAGCLMIRRRVFDRIEAELHEKPFDIIPPLGEDNSFFARCRKLGIHCWCAPRITCGHIDYVARQLDTRNLDRMRFITTERPTSGIGQAGGLYGQEKTKGA